MRAENLTISFFDFLSVRTMIPWPNFNTMICKPENFQSVADARWVLSTTGRESRVISLG